MLWQLQQLLLWRWRTQEIYRRMQRKSTARVADEDKQLHARCVTYLLQSPHRPRQARAPGQAGVCPLELHRRRPRARLSTARAVSAAVVRVRPPGNRAPSGQIDSESSGDDAIRIAMADTSNNTTSRSQWSSVQSTLYFTALHFTNDKFTLCTKPQRSILEIMARFLQN